MRRVRAAALAAGMAPAALSVRPATAQPAPGVINPVADPAADVARRVRETLDQDETVLLRGPGAAEREEAARRLVARQNADGDARVRGVMTADPANAQNIAVQSAVAKAVADDPTPDPQLVPALVRLLGAEKATQEAAAALSAYRNIPAARAPLVNYVTQNNPAASEAAQLARAAAVRGMGGTVDQAAAGVLVALLQDDRQPPAVRAAAADALGDMTLMRENGRDGAAWQAWWTANNPAAKTAERFRADVLDRVKRQRGGPPADPNLLQDLYVKGTPELKSDFLKRFLASPDPPTRATGVRLFTQTLAARGQLADPAGIRARARELVRDSDPAVRAEVATMLDRLNDRDALDAILTQLEQEPDPTVRAALIKAARTMGSPRAVPGLMRLLDDPSAVVAGAAAEALGDLGPAVRGDPALARAVRDRLQRVVDARGRSPGGGGGDGRAAAAIVALAKLGDPDVGRILELLNPRTESKETRRAAYQALEVLNDPRAADAVVRRLADEPEEEPKLAALSALERFGSFVFADRVLGYTGPAEPSGRVRRRAWQAFVNLLPSATPPQLRDWANTRFRDDAPGRAAVFNALAQKQAGALEAARTANDAAGAARLEEELAGIRENLGDAYLNRKPLAGDRPYRGEQDQPRPDLAAEQFRLALNYWLGHGGGPLAIQKLIDEEMRALLLSRQYAAAARFAQEMLARDPANQQVQQTVGTALAREAEDLLDQAKDPRAAQTLAAEAMKIDRPPLDRFFRDRLAALQSRAEQALRAAPGPRPPPTP